jgi:two-component system, LytTR family, response regulator LytT
MSVKVFVVEDELVHLEALKITIEELGLQLVGECGDADSAYVAIREAMPDVLLVDIALPGLLNGIMLAEKVNRELKIPHIFTTSFDSDEVISQAVKTNPVGYLRKPVDAVNLKAAVQIAVNNTGSNNTLPNDKQDLETVFVKAGDKLIRVNVDEIVMIKADGENYISLVTERKEILSRTTLKEFCKRLPGNFIQVHRSYYININHLDSFNERDQTAYLKGKAAPVARNYRKTFLNSIEKI